MTKFTQFAYLTFMIFLGTLILFLPTFICNKDNDCTDCLEEIIETRCEAQVDWPEQPAFGMKIQADTMPTVWLCDGGELWIVR